MHYLKISLLAFVCSVSSVLLSQVSVNVNIGTAPQWGPIGYNDARYYYLPDVEAYYDVHSSMFIYYAGGVWLHRTYLPSHHRHYDLYNGYKVVMTDYRGEKPYIHFKEYKIKYKKGYRGPAQKTIGQKHSTKTKNKSSQQPTQQQKKGSSGKSHGGGKGKK